MHPPRQTTNPDFSRGYVGLRRCYFVTKLERLRMELKEYPEAIASQKFLIMSIEKQIRWAKEEMLLKKLKVKNAIASCPDLKNENQRTLKLELELLQDKDYVETKEILDGLLDSKTHLEIQAELLANQFSIAKLELRERIARIESLSDD